MYFKFLSLLFNINLVISSISYIDGDYWFPFPTSFEYSNKSVLDMSYLNWKIEERIKIKNGHFYYKDKQVKFLVQIWNFQQLFHQKKMLPLLQKECHN